MPRPKRQPRHAHGAPGTEVDYYDKLSPEDAEWLRKFNRESVHDYFKKGEKPLHGRKGSNRRRSISKAKYHRKEDATYQSQIPLSLEMDKSRNPEDVLVRAVDAFSSTDLATHLRKKNNLPK